MSWLHGTAARLRLLFARRSSESRFEREIQFHVEMETARLVREGKLDPAEARRRAFATFGGVEKHREALRDGRGAAWLGGLSLDFKLGLRMLVKRPGLTLVGVLGISVAVTIGALAFSAVNAITTSDLPLDEGDRVVAIQNVDTRRTVDGSRTHLHDLPVWREALRDVREIGAYRAARRNLIPVEGSPEAVRVAEMTASGFHLARVAPVRGRYLSDDDEREGAPDVVVIGYDLWQRRFGGRDVVVGSTVQLGAVRHTVVGVMPKGFAFPVNYQMWTPLRLNPSAYERGRAPSLSVFARLAPGATLAGANLQLAAIGQQIRAEHPQSHEYIRPRVVSYARSFAVEGQNARLLHLGQVVVSLLLVVIATNVGVLVYARTASRAGEMAVRTALGASRRRIVTQLFAEALVLSGAASLVGIFVAQFIFRRVETMVTQAAGDEIPYWMRLEVTPGVVVYVAGLAVLAAVIIGVIPGLKATHARVFASLKDLSGSSMRLGRTWTALLVAQVAVSVGALPATLGGGEQLMRRMLLDRGTPVTNSFVMATPRMEVRVDEVSGGHDRYANRVAEIVVKLESEPGGFDVVLTSSTPGSESSLSVALDTMSAARKSDPTATLPSGGSVAIAHVSSNFFSAFEVRVLAGRTFTVADFTPGATSVIVNRSFVRRFIGTGNALGQRFRQDAARTAATGAEPAPEPWWEIVGVVEEFPALLEPDALRPRAYLPLRPAGVFPLTLAARARSLTPAATADRVRKVAISVDPTLHFDTIRPLADLLEEEVKVERLALLGIVSLAFSVVLLSAAGIYALMSFTVERRHREIGIRVALGARSGRVLAEVLSRSMKQIGIGILLGVAGTAGLSHILGESSPVGEQIVWFLEIAALMAVVAIIASIGPARRVLRVQPTEALRSD